VSTECGNLPHKSTGGTMIGLVETESLGTVTSNGPNESAPDDLKG
jgi:hypothetical protein